MVGRRWNSGEVEVCGGGGRAALWRNICVAVIADSFSPNWQRFTQAKPGDYLREVSKVQVRWGPLGGGGGVPKHQPAFGMSFERLPRAELYSRLCNFTFFNYI